MPFKKKKKNEQASNVHRLRRVLRSNVSSFDLTCKYLFWFKKSKITYFYTIWACLRPKNKRKLYHSCCCDFKMNLADPVLEYIDPTPNVHSLFIHFDTIFFWTKLSGKAVVRWSKRMYSCAGTCSYEGKGGLCDIALSEPLLKLRPRKDLVETLLHEMIHAFLFVVGKDQSRNGHGPNFLSHMYRINNIAGVNISVYHDFHDEVKLYQNHVWRCNGACQKVRPYFGIVRRSVNKAPGPSEFWWKNHQILCGGTFIKCKEPEKPVKPVKQPHHKVKSPNSMLPNVDIRKFVINNSKAENKNKILKPVSKPPAITDNGQLNGRNRSNSVNVLETVRNVWANKTISNAVTVNDVRTTNQVKTKKRVSDVVHSDSMTPPKKTKKIDDYFKTTASSILKDIYGKDFEITKSIDSDKWKAVAVKENLVVCPICNDKVINIQINTHIDECLNKGLIEQLDKNTIKIIKPSTSQTNSDEIKKRKDTVLPFIPAFKPVNDTTIRQEPNYHELVANRQTEKYISASNRLRGKDLSTSNREVKIEPSTSKDCIDLTGFVQIKAEPTTSNSKNLKSVANRQTEKDISASNRLTGKDPSTSNREVKIEPSTSIDCIDLTGIVQIKVEPTTSNSKNLKSVANRQTEKDISASNMLTGKDLSTSNREDKIEPSMSNSNILENHTCPCCGMKIDKPIQEHLDECLVFFDNDSTIPEEGASTSFGDRTIVTDDNDDEFDETQTFNATGTKYPCPNCMNMVENADMNNHLDMCLGI